MSTINIIDQFSWEIFTPPPKVKYGRGGRKRRARRNRRTLEVFT